MLATLHDSHVSQDSQGAARHRYNPSSSTPTLEHSWIPQETQTTGNTEILASALLESSMDNIPEIDMPTLYTSSTYQEQQEHQFAHHFRAAYNDLRLAVAAPYNPWTEVNYQLERHGIPEMRPQIATDQRSMPHQTTFMHDAASPEAWQAITQHVLRTRLTNLHIPSSSLSTAVTPRQRSHASKAQQERLANSTSTPEMEIIQLKGRKKRKLLHH